MLVNEVEHDFWLFLLYPGGLQIDLHYVGLLEFSISHQWDCGLVGLMMQARLHAGLHARLHANMLFAAMLFGAMKPWHSMRHAQE